MSFQNKKENTYTKKRVPRKISLQYLENAGLYYLQRFASSTEHFKMIMNRKIYKSYNHHKDPSLEQSKIWLDEIIIRYQNCGLLNDTEYAKQMALRLCNAGKSTLIIQSKMKEKQLSQCVIMSAIQYIDTEYNGKREIISALRLSKKRRIGAFVNENNSKIDLQKQLGILARAGYDYETSQKVLKMSKEEAFNVLNL